jgi:hypothetical protein
MASNSAVVYDASQEVFQAIDAIRARLKNPPQTFDSYMETLLKQGLITAVAML